MRTARLVVLAALIVVAQVSVVPHLRIAGTAPALELLFTIAVAYRLGPEAGALTGFGTGLAFDLFLETPLGLSALTDAVVGYAVGVFTAGLLRVPRALPITLAVPSR
ncbi:MAG: rod shape-determining protein MreD [Actinomycetota bacterium]